MSTYELKDDLVRQALRCGQELPRAFVSALERQLPPILPTKLGAVVETEAGVFVRRIGNYNQARVWWRVPDGDWFRSAEVGDVFMVHSEGVDL